MKQSKSAFFLLALALMLIAPSSTVKTSIKTKPTTDWTLYYWFDAFTHEYLYRQSHVEDEIALTGLDESMQNPKTVWEVGYAPSSVVLGEWDIPVPYTFPDKYLYSHP